MPRYRRIVSLTLFGVCVHLSAVAQWVDQTIHLQPGWNAVFFEVQPYPRDSDSVFQGIPVESVWGWNRRFTSVEFVQDPNTLLPGQPEWLTYFPPTSPQSFLTNLFIIQGGRSYLIKLGGATPVDFVISGRPKIREVRWMSNSYNLVGFHLDGLAPPTLANFFTPSTAHAGQTVYQMNAAGRWQKVANPATETMQRGEAYWVYSNGESEYQGPLSVTFAVGDGLDYGRIGIEQKLRIQNASASNRTITLRQKPSGASPPDPAVPALAGDVPLSHFEFDIPNGNYGWSPLPTPMTLTIPAGEEAMIRLAVRRPDMAPFTPPLGRDALYESLLEVSDAAGSLLVLPVSAQGLDAPRVVPGVTLSEVRRTALGDSRTTTPHLRTGLWVGRAKLNAVSNPTSGSLTPDTPTTASSTFTFRLIIHVDATGQARLLQQVLQMWKEGAWIPNPDDLTSPPTTYVLDPNNLGRAVLLTDDSLIPQFSGVALRDVNPVGRRVSSAAFGFSEPVLMGGGVFGDVGGPPTTCVVVLDYKDPLNPFRHQYHPDHDNWDGRYLQKISEGKESYTITREISLHFTADVPGGRIQTPDWLADEFGGVYKEVFWGLHRNPIHTEGIFHLQRISDVPELNDGLR